MERDEVCEYATTPDIDGTRSCDNLKCLNVLCIGVHACDFGKVKELGKVTQCPDCHGSGMNPNQFEEWLQGKHTPCKTCNETGFVQREVNNGNSKMP